MLHRLGLKIAGTPGLARIWIQSNCLPRHGGYYDDDQMINIMVDEHAKQMGQNSAAILDSVCAAIWRIAYLTLAGEWDISQEFLRNVYENKKHMLARA
jgi:hypothetical protein